MEVSEASGEIEAGKEAAELGGRAKSEVSGSVCSAGEPNELKWEGPS
jgi:hypothetical protein